MITARMQGEVRGGDGCAAAVEVPERDVDEVEAHAAEVPRPAVHEHADGVEGRVVHDVLLRPRHVVDQLLAGDL